MEITPVIIGRGMAGQAMQRALAVVGLMHPEMGIRPSQVVERGKPLADYAAKAANPVLLIASPHALHTPAILEGEKAGFKAIICEKPSCVTLPQLEDLMTVQIPVSVCHGYRVMWGPRAIHRMIQNGELGKFVSMEGTYWQSSAAQRALEPPPAFQMWKNNPQLSGPFDALVDLGTHWIDMAFFLMGSPAESACALLSHLNSEAAHRDTHVHLDLAFSGSRRSRASISKTVHGTGNDFQFTVIGSRRALSWSFMNPDEIVIGEGSTRTIIQRKDGSSGSGSRPYHGLGWLEGYVEVIRQTLLGLSGQATAPVPTLAENIEVMRTVLSLKIMHWATEI